MQCSQLASVLSLIVLVVYCLAKKREKKDDSSQWNAWKESKISNSTIHFYRSKPRHVCVQPSKTISIMTIVTNAQSWGPGNSFSNFFSMIHQFDYPAHCISLSFLVSNQSEWQHMESIMTKALSDETAASYRTITHIYQPPVAPLTAYKDRKVQQQSKRSYRVAIIRNNLLAYALQDEEFTLWIDSDVIEIPAYLLKKAVHSGKDILVPRCNVYSLDKNAQEYDLNTWRGEMNAKGVFETRKVHLKDLTNSTADYEPIDSVGGTFMLVKSQVFHDGVIFPYMGLIEDSWEQGGGGDAIETEGICYQAKYLGYQCYGMPHDIILHAN